MTTYNNLTIEAIGDGTSRCGCCGLVFAAQSLAATKFQRNDVRQACSPCRETADNIAMARRIDFVDVSLVRARRNSEASA